MSRLVLICGEALLLAEEDAAPERAVVPAATAEALARLGPTAAQLVLVSDGTGRGSADGGAARARLHERMRDELARHGVRLEAILDPSAEAPGRSRSASLEGAFAAAIERFRADAGRTPVLCESLSALEAAAALRCPRILLRTRAGRAVQAAGIPDGLLPVGVQADVAAAAESVLRVLR